MGVKGRPAEAAALSRVPFDVGDRYRKGQKSDQNNESFSSPDTVLRRSPTM